MKILPPPRASSQAGLTLLEVTVVLSILLTLVTILYFGARGWKNGSDRASCIVMTRNVQVAVRSFQNLYGYDAGGHPYAENGTQNVGLLMLNKGYIEQYVYDELSGAKPCPGGGTYSVAVPDVFPVVGNLYMSCSLAAVANHAPNIFTDW